jgi:cytochrome P450
VVLRHADVLAALTGRYPLSSEMLAARLFGAVPASGHRDEFPAIRAAVPHWLVNMDPPKHSRMRALMMTGFKGPIIEELRPQIRKLIAQLLEDASASPECEIIHTVLRQITVTTIMRLIGIPEGHLADMHRWSDAITTPFVSGRPTADMLAAAEAVMVEMGVVLRAEVRRRRAMATDDFLSILVHAEVDGDRLSDDELVAQLIFLLIAGHESTTNTMALSLATLLRNRLLWPAFQMAPEANAASVLELMRHVAMSAAAFRLAAADFDWHGRQIRRGDLIFLMIASANRDPRVYERPDAVAVDRRNDRTLVFGGGAHHCIGHLLARMETGEVLPAVLNRFPEIRLRDSELNFGPGLAFRGLRSLWVRWS